MHPQKGRLKKQIVPKVSEPTCASCAKMKKAKDFYISYNPIHSVTGRIPYCKECLKKMISDDKGNVILDKVKTTLKLIDKPFLYNIWKVSLESESDTFGDYMKNLAMVQYRNLGWVNSKMLPETELELNYNNINSGYQNNSLNKDINTSLENFIISDEIVDKWGYGYSKEEYYFFEKKWNRLINNYGEKTSFHSEGLIIYIRFRVKEEIATAKGDVKDAKDWAAMAKDAATSAKINVSQLSKSDINGGVELIPQLFEAVESEIGIIPTLPKLKEQPYDDADLIIWCVVNYLRRLEDKPRVEYRDIWNFYDEMLEEHFKSQGHSEKEIELEKQKRNNVFRDLGKVYKEPIYEEGDL